MRPAEEMAEHVLQAVSADRHELDSRSLPTCHG